MILRRAFPLILCALIFTLLWGWSVAGTQATPPDAAIVQLTNDNAIAVRPAWSPDNQQIAYQSSRDGSTYHIYVMNADGSSPHALTQGSTDDRHPSWMPDGKSILFDSSDGKQTEIWMVNVADGSLKQLTHVTGEASFPSASPDGQHIAFYTYQNETLDLWTARIDGTEAKQLTQNLASAKNNQCTFACHQAAWSPDGQTIAYSAGELDTIWTVASNGGKPIQLSATGEDSHFPWFISQGQLGYITEHVNPVQSWTDAWIYDLKSGQTQLLQGHMSPQGPFEWNADDTKVLFHSPRSGNFQIYMVNLKAPGGVAALQGTPVPAAQAVTAPAASTPVSAAPTNAQAVATPVALYAAGLGILVVAVTVTLGLVLRRRAR